MPTHRVYIALSLTFILLGRSSVADAADVELIRLSRGNFTDIRVPGKESDSIIGDYVLRNEHLTLAIAQPLATRNANMTVKRVGGCLLDFGGREAGNDQLSCLYPLASRYQFTDPDKLVIIADGEMVTPTDAAILGATIEILIESEAHADGSIAQVRYALSESASFVEITTVVVNRGDQIIELPRRDSIRADRSFRTGVRADADLYFAYDEWFRACYGLAATGYTLRKAASNTIEYVDENGDVNTRIEPNRSETLTRRAYFASSQLELDGLERISQGMDLPQVSLTVADAAGAVGNARIVLTQGAQEIGVARTNQAGQLEFNIPPGDYSLEVSALGRPSEQSTLTVNESTEHAVELEACGYFRCEITDEAGEPLPCKISFYGVDGTADPFFGPDSKATGVHNTRYTPFGRFRQELGPGTYDIVVSRGPEYDAIVEQVEITQGRTHVMKGQLERVVDTPGWISAEFHSHSTPSGDNTSMQYGRVLNLLAEQIEFAPCTEHNRIDSYQPHIERLDGDRWLATCPGLELTGSLLPVNHQNAFPLRQTFGVQDGGAPLTDVDPVVQIERLAMLDYGSEKLVQSNHPKLVQILGDRNNDGEPDEGFREMFGFMDVMEVHPPGKIFDRPDTLPALDQRGNAIFQWLQLLNLGYRIPGVVNTDAHYNFHGSGWLRNYIRSSQDEPLNLSVSELVQASERGNIVMTNGPYLEVAMNPAGNRREQAFPGDDLLAPEGELELVVRVQCANWLDINRVQVLLNGRLDPDLNFTRRTHPEMFANEVVKFEQTLRLSVSEDTHVIVAVAGEELTLGRVMGPQRGGDMPVAVSNPIFVDLDGEGFTANQDRLGAPLPLPISR